jgi:hypothetical protein
MRVQIECTVLVRNGVLCQTHVTHVHLCSILSRSQPSATLGRLREILLVKGIQRERDLCFQLPSCEDPVANINSHETTMLTKITMLMLMFRSSFGAVPSLLFLFRLSPTLCRRELYADQKKFQSAERSARTIDVTGLLGRCKVSAITRKAKVSVLNGLGLHQPSQVFRGNPEARSPRKPKFGNSNNATLSSAPSVPSSESQFHTIANDFELAHTDRVESSEY